MCFLIKLAILSPSMFKILSYGFLEPITMREEEIRSKSPPWFVIQDGVLCLIQLCKKCKTFVLMEGWQVFRSWPGLVCKVRAQNESHPIWESTSADVTYLCMRYPGKNTRVIINFHNALLIYSLRSCQAFWQQSCIAISSTLSGTSATNPCYPFNLKQDHFLWRVDMMKVDCCRVIELIFHVRSNWSSRNGSALLKVFPIL